VDLKYKIAMKNKPLSQTNAYLRDPEKRHRAVLRSVLSSSAVEGILFTDKEMAEIERQWTEKQTAED
jgi:hypothetical protein